MTDRLGTDETREESSRRRIGRLGTLTRLLVGGALLVMAFLDKPEGLIFGLEVHELILGLVVLPGASVTIGLAARRQGHGPLRLTSPTAMTVNLIVIIALFAIPATAGAAALFFGTSLLIAAWRGQPDCEVMVWSNRILRRGDRIGCPTYTPIDTWEFRRDPPER